MSPLNLAIKITADAAGAKAGVADARAAMGDLAPAAQAAGAAASEALEQVSAASAGVAAAATGAAQAMGAMGQAEAGAAQGAQSATVGASAAARAIQDEQRAAQEAAAALGQLATARQRRAQPSGVDAAFRGWAAEMEASRLGLAAVGQALVAHGRALDDTRARYSPLYAAQRAYVAQLKEIREAESAGAFRSAAEAKAAIAQTKAAFTERVSYLRAANDPQSSTWARLRPDQRQNLMYQASDIVGSAASGLPLHMIAMQQGPQIMDALGGPRAALAALGAAINPVALGIGALTGVVVAGAAAWYSYTSATKSAATAASSFGRASGVTAGDIERAAYAGTDAGLSVAQARGVAVELTRTGKIGGEQFSGLIGIAKDFAATLQTDVASAGEQLGQIFGDPAAGAARLQGMGLLDGATARLAQSLAAQGEAGRAAQVMLDGLRTRLASSAEATTAAGRAWDALTTSVSDAWSEMGRSIAGGALPLDEQLKRARAEMAAPLPQGEAAYFASGLQQQQAQRIAELERQIQERDKQAAERSAAAKLDGAGSAAVKLAAASPVNAQLQEEIQLRARLAQLQAGAAAPNLTQDERGQVARDIEATRRALEGLNGAKERQVEMDRLDLQIQAERDPLAKAALVATREYLSLQSQTLTYAQEAERVEQARRKSLEESANAAKIASQTILDGLDKQIEATRLEVSLIGKSNSERARALALLQAQQDITAQKITDPAAQAEIRRKRVTAADTQSDLASEQAADAALRGGRNQVAQLEAEIALIGQSNAARARAIALLQVEQQIKAQDIRSPAKIEEMRAQALRAADLQSQLSAGQAGQSMWEAGRDRNEQLQLEAQLIGASSEARARAIALLQTEQQIRAAGIPAGSREAQVLRAQAAANADLAQSLERGQAAWSAYTSAGESALDKIGDAIATNTSDWRSVFEDVATDINKTLIKLAVTNPLKNMLFGGSAATLADFGAGGAAGGGLLGQLVAGLTGKAAQPAATPAAGLLGAVGLGALTVSAGVVYVNGGLAAGVAGAVGGTGLLGGGSVMGAATGLGGIGSDAAAAARAATGVPALAAARSAYAAELSDPGVQQMLFARVASENGGAGAIAQIESMLNRGIARGQSMTEVMGGSYWAKDGTANMQAMLRSGRVPDYRADLRAVMGGSNVSNYSTGNASYAPGNDHFNRYPFGVGGVHTAKVNGELYGQEAGTVGWQRKLPGLDQLNAQAGSAAQATQGLGSALPQVTSAAQQATQSAQSLGAGLGQAGSAAGAAGTAATSMASAAQGATSGLGGFAQSLASVLSNLGGGLGGGLGGALQGLGGLFGFADGGVMTSAGPLPLRAYAGGGIADSPQLTLFGEGRTPEAFVPLPDGRRIPVAMTLSGGANDNGAAAMREQMAAVRGQLAAMRAVVAASPAAAGGGASPAPAPITIHNYAGADVRAERDPSTGRMDLYIDEMQAKSMTKTGSKSNRALAGKRMRRT